MTPPALAQSLPRTAGLDQAQQGLQHELWTPPPRPLPSHPAPPLLPLWVGKQVQKPGAVSKPKGNAQWGGPCQAWPVSGSWGPGPMEPLRVSTRCPEPGSWGLGLEEEIASSTGVGGTLEQAGQWGPHSLWGRGHHSSGSAAEKRGDRGWMGGRGGVLDTGRSGPGEKSLRQAGTCQADPGGPWGEGREASSDTAAPTLCRGRGQQGIRRGSWTELTFQGPGPCSPRLWLPSGPL